MIKGLVFFLSLCLLALCDDNVQVTVSSDTIGEPIPPDFVGFSFEISGILAMTGRSPSPPKASFVQLLKNLRITPNSPGPNLRIGGNSADESWWDPDNKPRPPKITYNIGPIDLISVNNVAKETNGSIVFDVNFRQADNPIWAVNHVRGIKQYVGFDNVDGIEIGNECDLYGSNGIRNSSFTFADYEKQWLDYVNAVYAVGTPKPIIQGATFCCLRNEFDIGLVGLIPKYRDLLKSVSYHRYPLDHCGGHVATMEQLLSDSSTVNQARLLAPFAKASTMAGLPFRIGEGNSVACGGMPGVSNVFGSALWAVDVLFNMASINAKRWNFHGGAQSTYTAIGYKTDSATVPDVRPLYYAMWLVAETTSNYGTLLSTDVKTTNPLIKAWSVTNKKQINIVVIHKDPKATSMANVSVTLANKSNSPASLARLDAKGGINSEYGVSYAGQTFDGSRDGKPVGNRVVTTVTANNGVYTFTLPQATIAVLTVPQ